MSELDRYQENPIGRRMPFMDEYPPQEDEAGSNILASVKSRWYIVLFVTLLIAIPGIPAIWMYTKPVYTAVSKLRIAHMMENPLTGEEYTGGVSSYQSFANTQAGMVVSSEVVEKVALSLADTNMDFFSGEPTGLLDVIKQKLNNRKELKPDIATVLRQAIYRGDIAAVPERNSYLLQVMTMSPNPGDARRITDEFVTAYRSVVVDASKVDRNSKLRELTLDQGKLKDHLDSLRVLIRNIAEEFGTRGLNSRQDMMLQRVTALLEKKTEAEANKISLQAQVDFLENSQGQPIARAELLQMKNNTVKSDPMVVELIGSIIMLEKELIEAEQTLAPTNYILEQKRQILEAFKARLVDAKERAGKEFDEMVASATEQAGEERLLEAQKELKKAIVLELALDDVLERVDSNTVKIGMKQLDIKDLEFDVQVAQDNIKVVKDRVRELKWEEKRSERISLVNNAQIARIDDKRTKLSAALVFGAAALGMFLALLRDKADVRLRTPEDVTKTIGVRIIGTTTSTKQVKKALLPQQVAEDYQTIHANLGLLDHHGMPKTVVIASPGMQEGKTTFSINLATSMARAGKKVLLIDGDLRKPDIGALLGIPRGSRGLQNLIWSRNGEQVVYSIPDMSLDVLTADTRNQSDAYELLALPHTAECIEAIGADYDHVIIDTPPVLAFADALLWARMADAAILASFAGKTTAPDLKETKEKLSELGIRILGTVLTNVHTDYSYYRYGHSYYSQNRDAGSNKKAKRRRMLLLPVDSSSGNGKSS